MEEREGGRHWHQRLRRQERELEAAARRMASQVRHHAQRIGDEAPKKHGADDRPYEPQQHLSLQPRHLPRLVAPQPCPPAPLSTRVHAQL